MKDRTYESHFEGMPTGPDVTRLNRRWPDLEIGSFIYDKDIEEELGLKRERSIHNRYATVVQAWINDLEKNRQLIVRRQRGADALKVLNVEEVAMLTDKRTVGAVRGLRKSRRETLTVQPKNDREQQIAIHRATVLKAMETSLKNERKELTRLPTATTAPTLRIAGKGEDRD